MKRIISIISIFLIFIVSTVEESIANDVQINVIDSLLEETRTTMMNVDINKTIELSLEALDLSTES